MRKRLVQRLKEGQVLYNENVNEFGLVTKSGVYLDNIEACLVWWENGGYCYLEKERHYSSTYEVLNLDDKLKAFLYLKKENSHD